MSTRYPVGFLENKMGLTLEINTWLDRVEMDSVKVLFEFIDFVGLSGQYTVLVTKKIRGVSGRRNIVKILRVCPKFTLGVEIIFQLNSGTSYLGTLSPSNAGRCNPNALIGVDLYEKLHSVTGVGWYSLDIDKKNNRDSNLGMTPLVHVGDELEKAVSEIENGFKEPEAPIIDSTTDVEATTTTNVADGLRDLHHSHEAHDSHESDAFGFVKNKDNLELLFQELFRLSKNNKDGTIPSIEITRVIGQIVNINPRGSGPIIRSLISHEWLENRAPKLYVITSKAVTDFKLEVLEVKKVISTEPSQLIFDSSSILGELVDAIERIKGIVPLRTKAEEIRKKISDHEKEIESLKIELDNVEKSIRSPEIARAEELISRIRSVMAT